ncbi:helix-hairpin-helix domain-containing protein [Turicibacter bilis]|uniref:Helix-hairpin-helix domain-containing protein n=1 Tax=Turicibacter bilis TaxID=2735723 RepID=A0ABY5JLY9_9FIRM|nr:helix-hairpin-helix domain-containing protein [Turicibacter bilis]MBS3199644.1 helix-hairpin-helix domain-containing protein [Turicibacter bilis]UUF06505.1 helix-hairpin-helix domain-containing protein [Turicibacter bilis]
MKKQIIIIGLASLIMITIFYLNPSPSSIDSVSLDSYVENEREVTEIEEIESAEEEVNHYIVDVKGQVNFPGVYEVEEHLRVHDVIQLAGGFLEMANETAINLAQKISDEMVIYVPHLDEEINNTSTDAWSPSQDEKKVSLNQATVGELETLPGIGPSKAAAIINYREEFGKFKSIDELTNVSGIGEKTLEKLRDSLEL